MAKIFSVGGSGQGRWFTADWKGIEAIPEGERPQFLIRPLPDAKAREVNYRYFGHKGQFREKKGEVIVEADKPKSWASRVEKGAFVLLDTKNAEFQVNEGDLASLASKALGREVAEGEWVAFDGKLTDEIKRALFEQGEDGAVLLSWIESKTEELCAIRLKDEDELGKT